MTNECAQDVRRAVTRATMLLTLAVGASGSVRAAIDQGRTIESVARVDSGVVLDAHPGVVDARTGLQWIKSSTLQEGQALGFRQATTDEFRTFLMDKSWTSSLGLSDQWTLNDGFSYSFGTSRGSNYATSSDYVTTNQAAVSFGADVSKNLPALSSWQAGGALSASLGWLLDGSGGTKVGGWFDRLQRSSFCSASGGSYSCSSVDSYAHDALVADWSALAGGAYNSSSHATGGDWSSLLQGVPLTGQTPQLMYFMVASVPEPSSYALMALGLAGLGLVARRSRHAAVRAA